MTRILMAAAAALVLGAASAPAFAQTAEVSALADRLNRLERSLRDVQAQIYQGDVLPAAQNAVQGAAPGAATGGFSVDEPTASRILVQISDLQREVQRLTGDLEQIRFEQRQTADRLERFIADTEFRLQSMGVGSSGGLGVPPAADAGPADLTGAAGPQAAAGPDAGAAGDVPAGIVDLTSPGAEAPAPVGGVLTLPEEPGAAFDYAYGLLLRGDYANAETGLTQFLEKYPNHEKAPEAQHRLGEIYFVRGDYANAAAAFLKNVQTFPQSARAPESLLRLGMSLAQLGETGEACKTFNAVPTRYPNASENLLQRAQTEKGRAGC